MLFRRLLPLLVALAFVVPVFATERIAIINADEVRGLNGKWDRFIKLSQEHGANLSLGIILNSLEKSDPAYEAWLKKMGETSKVEFWNHGWDHKQ